MRPRSPTTLIWTRGPKHAISRAVGPEVVGRENELAAVAFFLSDTEERARALLLEGEAGIGKSTPWRAAVASALDSGMAVLSCAPSEPESSLAFVALGDLVGHHAATLPSLPRPSAAR